jgi:hypothetical protein
LEVFNVAEAGGPTTQSGILYQNSIAALYLGRMIDPASRSKHDRVLEVRVEAPTDVDDIAVTFADGHVAYIQAKENVEPRGEVLVKLSKSLEAQSESPNFQGLPKSFTGTAILLTSMVAP